MSSNALFETLVGDPELDLAHPGVSITSAPPGSWTSSRRVVVFASFSVVASLPGLGQLLTREGVHECRLADAGRPQQRRGDPRTRW